MGGVGGGAERDTLFVEAATLSQSSDGPANMY